MFYPNLATTVTRSHHRRCPSMQLCLIKKRIYSSRPETVFTEWITTGKHYATFDSIGNPSLLIRSPDHALISSRCKVTKRILINIVCDESSNNLDIVITHLCKGLHSSEEEEEWNHNSEDAKCSEAKFDSI